jgi:methylmalonyl-CoA/ethylmalonyl-CoA epimerase
MPLYRDVLGGTPLFGGANKAAGYRALQMRFADGTRIELLDPIPDSEFLNGFLASRPTGGIHHLTFRVPDFDRAIDRLRHMSIPTFGEHDSIWQREVFVHPRDAHGTLIQLIEPLQAHPPSLTRAQLAEFLAG